MKLYLVILRNSYSETRDIEQVISAHKTLCNARTKAQEVGGEVIEVEVIP